MRIVWCLKCLNTKYTVDLTKWMSTYRKWELKGFPFSHAVACVRGSNLRMEDYIEKEWFVQSYRGSYDKPILPIPTAISDQFEFPYDTVIYPPAAKRLPGKPKQHRLNTKGGHESVNIIQCNTFGWHNKKVAPFLYRDRPFMFGFPFLICIGSLSPSPSPSP